MSAKTLLSRIVEERPTGATNQVSSAKFLRYLLQANLAYSTSPAVKSAADAIIAIYDDWIDDAITPRNEEVNIIFKQASEARDKEAAPLQTYQNKGAELERSGVVNTKNKYLPLYATACCSANVAVLVTHLCAFAIMPNNNNNWPIEGAAIVAAKIATYAAGLKNGFDRTASNQARAEAMAKYAKSEG